MSKKFLELVLCLIIILSSSICVYATDLNEDINSDIELMYEYTQSANTFLNISSSIATCKFTFLGYSQVTKVVITMTLQQKTLFWWSTEETWTTTVYKEYASFTKTTSVDSGTYRVKTVFTVYSGTDYETITDYSAEVTY